MIDFSGCEPSGITYGGSEKKIGIIFKKERYILKFRKNVIGEASFSIVSEYLGSHIFETLGVPVHKTYLGYYNNAEVVALKDFTEDEKILVEFNSVGGSTLDSEDDAATHTYDYSTIREMMYRNKKLIDPKEVEHRFWVMFVVDALLGNFDRHGYNWGHLRNKQTQQYTLAPVYDNGSCLFPRAKEDELLKIINSVEEMDKRTFQFPSSQIKLNGKKSSYYEVINSKEFRDCTKAAKWLISTIDFSIIDKIIDGISIVSEERKLFYKTIIKYRFDKIFKDSFSDNVEVRRW